MTERAISLLDRLIATPSLSRHENATADHISAFLEENGVVANRCKNNVWAVSDNYDSNRPTLLLNSHHDTVKPSATYTRPL